MRKILVGPILKDVEEAGLSGKEIVIATAFYTAGPLNQLRMSAKKVTLAVRLDLNELTDWISGCIDPPALLQAARRLIDHGSEVRLYVDRNAHAKMYVGEDTALIGSANLTTRGLSGVGNEVMWCVPMAGEEQKALSKGVRRYLSAMTLIQIDDLKQFVEKNASFVEDQKKSRPQSEESRPKQILEKQRPSRLGSYKNFLAWLARQRTDAAREILERANGKGNLSGHIYRNYYGLRQYLIYSTKKLEVFRRESEDHYKLSADAATEEDISQFVRDHATDEADFSLEKWMTYLPEECGGRAGKHGGTIGNLNRMLPLVAKYMSPRLSKQR